MPMKKENIYLSTIASDAPLFAREYGLGLEIAEYSTAWNMDRRFEVTDPRVKESLKGISRSILHAPVNELFPCAVDEKARELAACRYRQAIDLAEGYGSHKIVIHGGYTPWFYHPAWYVSQSIAFWKDFLKENPDVNIVLENVLETTPDLIVDIVEGVNDPRLRMCFDVGHINAYSYVPILDWLETCAPWIGHIHINNNDGREDQHSGLHEGSVPMKEVLRRINSLCPEATVTLEMTEVKPSLDWLQKERIWHLV